MDGSENDGINIVLVGGFLFIIALIIGAVWLYRHQSLRRRKNGRKE